MLSYHLATDIYINKSSCMTHLIWSYRSNRYRGREVNSYFVRHWPIYQKLLSILWHTIKKVFIESALTTGKHEGSYIASGSFIISIAYKEGWLRTLTVIQTGTRLIIGVNITNPSIWNMLRGFTSSVVAVARFFSKNTCSYCDYKIKINFLKQK